MLESNCLWGPILDRIFLNIQYGRKWTKIFELIQRESLARQFWHEMFHNFYMQMQRTHARTQKVFVSKHNFGRRNKSMRSILYDWKSLKIRKPKAIYTLQVVEIAFGINVQHRLNRMPKISPKINFTCNMFAVALKFSLDRKQTRSDQQRIH